MRLGGHGVVRGEGKPPVLKGERRSMGLDIEELGKVEGLSEVGIRSISVELDEQCK
jgi:hypothetical protein